MPEAPEARSLERSAELVVAEVYERVVEASLESVWENVYDWEHLPWLHEQAFASIDLIEAGDWGWSAEVGFPGGTKSEIELVTDRAAGHYVARTRAGAGAPGEIWTSLDSVSAERTGIRVEFCVPPLPEDALARIGAAYLGLYSGLWDQDEEMMQTRARAFADRAQGSALASGEAQTRGEADDPAAADEVPLGPWEALRGRLPEVVVFGGYAFRIVEIEGGPVAHSIQCPHWLGPLDACPVEQGVVTCPWHGYRFDVASGVSADGRSFRLRPAPRVEIDRETGLARLVDARGGEKHRGV